MFYNVYIACAFAATLAFLWLSWIGPPLPVAHQTYLPRIEPHPLFLLGNVSYRSFNNPLADQLWNELIPPNGGAVLGTNISTGFHVWAVPAMFHQLKCLRTIRSHFIGMLRSAATAEELMTSKGPGSAYDEVTYCFDYMRQSILCNADTTLHPMAKLTPDRNLIDGNALWHMCKDSSLLYQWAGTSGMPRTDHLVRQRPIKVGAWDSE